MLEGLKSSENKPLIRSFGRIKSRKLSDHKNHLLFDILLKYEFSPNSNYDILEIGFGFGDFLFAKAQQNPQKNFLGCEPHINGVVNLLSKIEKDSVQNIKISRQDVRLLLAELPNQSFEQVYILFPDPWPKAKHFKRRLINQNFLDLILAPKIKSGGNLTIATDHDSYKTWILAEIAKSQKFLWKAQEKKDWQVFPVDWVETKYQKKAALEGRNSVIFNLVRNDK